MRVASVMHCTIVVTVALETGGAQAVERRDAERVVADDHRDPVRVGADQALHLRGHVGGTGRHGDELEVETQVLEVLRARVLVDGRRGRDVDDDRRDLLRLRLLRHTGRKAEEAQLADWSRLNVDFVSARTARASRPRRRSTGSPRRSAVATSSRPRRSGPITTAATPSRIIWLAQSTALLGSLPSSQMTTWIGCPPIPFWYSLIHFAVASATGVSSLLSTVPRRAVADDADLDRRALGGVLGPERLAGGLRPRCCATGHGREGGPHQKCRHQQRRYAREYGRGILEPSWAPHSNC